jgi:hypothetical protein
MALTCSLLLATSQGHEIHAATSSNNNYQLEIETLDVPPDEQIPEPIQPPSHQTANAPGIAFIPSPFSFSISESLIDFGILSATNPVTRATTLTVTSPGTGYQVFAFANHSLRTKASALVSGTNASIPDTTCDNGSCSDVTAALWKNNLTYGFGFRCDAERQTLCPNGFDEKEAYKQFSDLSKKETIKPIIQNNASTAYDEARITYRINIAGTQQKDAYSNMVTYIAVPNF